MSNDVSRATSREASDFSHMPASSMTTSALIVLFGEVAGRMSLYGTRAMHDRYWELRRELESRFVQSADRAFTPNSDGQHDIKSVLEGANRLGMQSTVAATDNPVKDLLGKRTPNFEAVEAMGLPTPRLQFRWEKLKAGADEIEGDDWLCHYELVIRLDKNDIRNPREYKQASEKALPLGGTKVNRESDPFRFGVVDTPFRDGAHMRWDAEQLGIQHVYAIYGEHVTELRAQWKKWDANLGITPSSSTAASELEAIRMVVDDMERHDGGEPKRDLSLVDRLRLISMRSATTSFKEKS